MVERFTKYGNNGYFHCSLCGRETHANNNKVFIAHKKACAEPQAQPTQEQIDEVRTVGVGGYVYLCSLSGRVQLVEGQEESLRRSGHSTRDILDGNHDF